MTVRINPSILAADFANFETELHRIATADLVHVDVMDNHFVPNLTFGLPMVARLNEVSPIPLDVHLMIDDPDRWALAYADAGAHSVTFHAEASAEPIALARRLRQAGSRAGIALKPGTSEEQTVQTLDEFDQILVMTVEPGFGGQSFMHEMMPKLAACRSAIDRSGRDVWLQVDGGINVETISEAARNGADTFVAGSGVFKKGTPEDQIRQLRETAAGASGQPTAQHR